MVCVSNCLYIHCEISGKGHTHFLEMGLTDAHAACTYDLKESPIRLRLPRINRKKLFFLERMSLLHNIHIHNLAQ